MKRLPEKPIPSGVIRNATTPQWMAGNFFSITMLEEPMLSAWGLTRFPCELEQNVKAISGEGVSIRSGVLSQHFL